MNNDRELIHAARRWHTAHKCRMVVGAEKRRLDKAIKAGEAAGFWSLLFRHLAEAGCQVTELKRKELAALRALAKACVR